MPSRRAGNSLAGAHPGLIQVDPDTSMCPTPASGLASSGRRSRGHRPRAGRASQHRLLLGSPPGHHAERAAMGFASSTTWPWAFGMRSMYGLERVALIDFDVHHGNGSEDISG